MLGNQYPYKCTPWLIAFVVNSLTLANHPTQTTTHFAHALEVLGLGGGEAERLDDGGDLCQVSICHGRGGGGELEEGRCDRVDLDIRRLMGARWVNSVNVHL